ncbi:MAG: bifunctional glutamate N-acetyltransferase/amino-acid acetyltransferase ArgJ [Pseudomonadota bacterium]|nr:bifunctional glutamate N-acetyltransferase/amino-acid acetyltransferase ArgJ [Pseudomonadota bacterium]HJO36623.1 bifunctional glutamate N-acetyltransferase/amino-acid acetyltransferase ArgJ [Gammaproteobacteria bacterium]
MSEPADGEALLAVPGIEVAAVAAGIRKPDRLDLTLLRLAPAATCAAVFTRNAFQAAPVVLARRHLQAGPPRALLINTGYANAGTGPEGAEVAATLCAAAGKALDVPAAAVLPFSTGVIGESLPTGPVLAALPGLVAALRPDGWARAAQAICTTDTRPKAISRRVRIGGYEATITGIAKGAGMIRPDMATMLAFIGTDLAIAPGPLAELLRETVDRSFNRITVDGDTSTNDAVCLVASGAGPALSPAAGDDWARFGEALQAVCLHLAQAIVRDGEGATRFVEIVVEDAADAREARAVADAIAHSPLVKTACFAGDPNWGRILAAVGRAGVEGLDISRVRLWLDEVVVVTGGGRDPAYREADGQRVCAQSAYTIRVALGRGTAAVAVWTCDLSYDYVRINADYRT